MPQAPQCSGSVSVLTQPWPHSTSAGPQAAPVVTSVVGVSLVLVGPELALALPLPSVADAESVAGVEVVAAELVAPVLPPLPLAVLASLLPPGSEPPHARGRRRQNDVIPASQ